MGTLDATRYRLRVQAALLHKIPNRKQPSVRMSAGPIDIRIE